MKFFKHFYTVTYHKWLVLKGCFRVGLYKQGILHDMSKYTPTEFLVGCRYFQGHRSPNNAEREEIGYSSSWLHHKGRNKHHYEYWIDYGPPTDHSLCGMKMPQRFVVEMLMDRIAACKVYKKDKYTDQSPLEYYEAGKDFALIHDETRELLETMLQILAEKGEKATFKYIKEVVLNKDITKNDYSSWRKIEKC